MKVSHVEASEITKAARMYLESDKGALLIEKAKANLAEREKVDVSEVIDVASVIAVSPKLVAAAEAKKSKAGTLSKTQAGKVKTKARGEAHATQH